MSHETKPLGWTDEHGPDELYDKFKVIRVSTGKPLEPQQFTFVLLPEYDEAACAAIRAYADAVEHRAPQLADQLRAKIDDIETMNR